ncbi:MAG TPA: hypothetical protein VND94_19805 [Terriglobia bacterium]|nr:hypothetical protein [Terriglobia bacterium]
MIIENEIIANFGTRITPILRHAVGMTSRVVSGGTIAAADGGTIAHARRLWRFIAGNPCSSPIPDLTFLKAIAFYHN